MASPTFTLMQPYEGTLPVYHFDLYRLNDIDEYYAAGLDEFVGADGVALVEWPPEELEAPPCVTLELSRGAAEEDRRIRMGETGMGERMNQIARALAQWEEKA
jgi:tRNA threonylcarbamoyladenosine biosynthesis protein TsaE